MKLKLKVKANPEKDCMVPNYEAQEHGIKRFIGWIFKMDLEPRPGFVQVDKVEEVPNRKEYRDCLISKELLPGDESTAKLLNLPLGK